nr:hypothetical protein [Mesorhizobium sp.]
MRPFLAQCRECQLPERRMHDMIVAAMQENRAIIKSHIERMGRSLRPSSRGDRGGRTQGRGPAEAARAINTAFTPFFHPILIEHCVQHGEDTEAALREQIRFILKALGKSA